MHLLPADWYAATAALLYATAAAWPPVRRTRVNNPRYANGHRRRALRARVLAAYDTCALCGHPVDKTLRRGPDGKPHPMSPEVDEILPVSLGGDPLAWENTQLVHRVCNQRKGNGRHGAGSATAENAVARRPLPVSQNW